MAQQVIPLQASSLERDSKFFEHLAQRFGNDDSSAHAKGLSQGAFPSGFPKGPSQVAFPSGFPGRPSPAAFAESPPSPSPHAGDFNFDNLHAQDSIPKAGKGFDQFVVTKVRFKICKAPEKSTALQQYEFNSLPCCIQARLGFATYTPQHAAKTSGGLARLPGGVNREEIMKRLENKFAVITGGAGGIGQAAARLFVAEGAKVLLVDIDEAKLKSVAASLGEANAGYCVADVSDPAATQHYAKAAIDRFGRIDVLFSNAGTEGRIFPLVDYPVEAFDKVIAINVRGVFLSLKYIMPIMAQNGGGSIVITSSIAGLHGFAGLSAYCTSKHALVGMMRSAVLECTPAGVRVNTIHPSPIETRMMRSIEEGAAPGAAAAAKTSFENMIPAKRYGAPEEVASLALFLASDDSRFCSGGLYSVDGGMSVG